MSCELGAYVAALQDTCTCQSQYHPMYTNTRVYTLTVCFCPDAHFCSLVSNPNSHISDPEMSPKVILHYQVPDRDGKLLRHVSSIE